jgi:hypothetical protein
VWTGAIPARVPWQLRLFANDFSPDSATTALSFVEVTAGGYASVELVPANWTVTASEPALIEYPAQTFSFTDAGGSPTAYGYYITDVLGEVAVAERFATPVATIGGTRLLVTPRVTLESAESAGGGPE